MRSSACPLQRRRRNEAGSCLHPEPAVSRFCLLPDPKGRARCCRRGRGTWSFGDLSLRGPQLASVSGAGAPEGCKLLFFMLFIKGGRGRRHQRGARGRTLGSAHGDGSEHGQLTLGKPSSVQKPCGCCCWRRKGEHQQGGDPGRGWWPAGQTAALHTLPVILAHSHREMGLDTACSFGSCALPEERVGVQGRWGGGSAGAKRGSMGMVWEEVGLGLWAHHLGKESHPDVPGACHWFIES